ncbi:MAG TPA: cell wall-binding repeat-containing protein [Ornithinimicrobium sp.]|uniref:cell wall-binding repeat-containing protein n=1 Tax=Ornithinimicrobium sp. TaxID=1977084 RepID=UPI002B466D54|nr:cell wall-binding repeat-containing protein [Ornithinimicrobium sp.]HKJ13157.1 cell wall-binding repeat-containing protein [Ornithinimicrobium sp.]
MLVVALLLATLSLGGWPATDAADAHRAAAQSAMVTTASPTLHAKGGGGAAATTRSWTPPVRPVNTLACTVEEECDCGPPRAPVVEREAGGNRYGTAAELVPRFRNTVSTVYIVNGNAFPDAASAAAAAGAGVVPDRWRGRAWAPAPLLLTGRDSLPAPTRAALESLSLERIVIVGGTGVVSEAVRDELGRYADPVLRVGGRSRYAVSALLAERFPADTDTVYVASGEDGSLADALTGGALAAQEGAPVLLTRPDRVDPATREALDVLNPARTVVLGGPNAVSSEVYDRIGADARLDGDNRYGTAVAVARRFGAEQPGAFLASGRAYADALTGAALAGSLRQPLLLSGSERIPDEVMGELDRLSPARFTLLGGTGPLSLAVEDQANRHYPTWIR